MSTRFWYKRNLIYIYIKINLSLVAEDKNSWADVRKKKNQSRAERSVVWCLIHIVDEHDVFLSRLDHNSGEWMIWERINLSVQSPWLTRRNIPWNRGSSYKKKKKYIWKIAVACLLWDENWLFMDGKKNREACVNEPVYFPITHQRREVWEREETGQEKEEETKNVISAKRNSQMIGQQIGEGSCKVLGEKCKAGLMWLGQHHGIFLGSRLSW